MAERRRTRLTPNGDGKHVASGPELRTAPPVDSPWHSTFHLRWWQHAVKTLVSAPPKASAERPAPAAPVRRRRAHPQG
jgi:hypothetical protein